MDGITFEDFQTDQKTIYAVTSAVVIISESVKSIPISSREQYPQVPWKSITGLGKKLIYHYFDVNLQVLWNTVQEELVILKPIIQEILAQIINNHGDRHNQLTLTIYA
ncbi:MAG: DUF86 domain-containing protein [Pleurocapsa minor HA4230-MV1]|nr:DUF86 domain-containing protein [Pleurocapsa minor HA4230-MV1]